MHFVIQHQCPERLANKKTQWTAPWIAYYHAKKTHALPPKKPNDAHWRDDDIRLPLIQNFHQNCAYCGELTPTPQHGTHVSKGDVDHFLPKADYPELVYEWTNYVWACKPCNQLKNKFFSVKHPLFNPYCQADCSQLIFIEDTGQYALHQAVVEDKYWHQRLENSERKTLLNAEGICQKRRLRISVLRQCFTSIATYIQLMPKNPTPLSRSLQVMIKDHITEILDLLHGPDFYALLQNQYQRLLQEYPQVADSIKSHSH